MTRIKIHISNVKLPFYPPCEVKCMLQNRVSTKSDQNHPRGGPGKSPSSARQGRGQKVWSAIKSNISDHSIEKDRY